MVSSSDSICLFCSQAYPKPGHSKERTTRTHDLLRSGAHVLHLPEGCDEVEDLTLADLIGAEAACLRGARLGRGGGGGGGGGVNKGMVVLRQRVQVWAAVNIPSSRNGGR